jgi:hypothetical protein
VEYDKVGQVEVAGIGRVQPAQQDSGGVDAQPLGQHMGWGGGGFGRWEEAELLWVH